MTGDAWRIELGRRAEKDLDRLDPAGSATCVIKALRRLASDDDSLDIKRLAASTEARMRVGAWRVRFVRDAQTRTLVVVRILSRGRAYDR